VTGLSTVAGGAGGTAHSLAVKQDGTVRAWGGNASGQLGTGNTTNQSSPVQVSSLNGYCCSGRRCLQRGAEE
jgi:alpha-tubulin suppressor-like RCC1 family protein